MTGSYRWTERLTSSLSGTYGINKEDEAGIDNDFFTVEPSVGYVLTPNITLVGSVSYSEYHYDDDSLDANQFRAMVGINCLWPRVFGSD